MSPQRLACRQLTLETAHATLTLFESRWREGPETHTVFENIMVDGRVMTSAEEAAMVLHLPSRELVLQEHAEYYLVAQAEQEASFFPELGSAGLYREDPSVRGRGQTSSSGRLCFAGYVGKTRLRIRSSDKALLSLPCRVVSQKLSAEESEGLLTALSRYTTGLLLRPEGPLQHTLQTVLGNGSFLERLLLLRTCVALLPKAIAELARAPHSLLQQRRQLVSVEDFGTLRPEAQLEAISQHGVIRQRRLLLTGKSALRKTELSLDTSENRHVCAIHRWLVQERRSLLRQSREEGLRSLVPAKIPALPSEFATLRPRELQRPSLRLARTLGYETFWKIGLLRRARLVLSETGLLVSPLHTMARLYEIWCYLWLAESVADYLGVAFSPTLLLGRHGTLSIDTTTQELLPGVSIAYQRSFSQEESAAATVVRPDITLDFFGLRLVFDAKYRFQEKGPQHEDWLVAHAYKDALHADASLLLYPGDLPIQLRQQRPPTLLPAIGAISLRPSRADKARDELFAMLQRMVQEQGSQKAAETPATYGRKR